METLFYQCYNITSLNLSGWSPSKVTTMKWMFHNCTSLQSIDLTNWDTSSVIDMYSMFYKCPLSYIDVSSWDTSKVSDMRWVFGECLSLDNLDVSGWDTSSVTRMDALFYKCQSLKTVNVSNWNTSNVTNMYDLFYKAYAIKVDLSSFIMTSVTNVADMFTGCDINVSGTTSNYDNTLISWAAQSVNTGLSFHAGVSNYSSAAQAARDHLTTPVIDGGKGWTITDGVLVV
jgi:surface protein